MPTHPNRVQQPAAGTPQDDLERLIRGSRRLVGCLAPDVEPGVDTVDWLSVMRFAEVSSDDNPLYTDIRYGAASPHLTMLAPPAFVLAIRSPCSTGALDMIPHRLVARVAAMQVTWNDTIRLGERVDGRVRVAGVTRESAKLSSERVRVRTNAEYTRCGDRFAQGLAEVEIAGSDEQPARSIHRYGPVEIDRMRRELDEEACPRGTVPRFFGDVAIGDVLPAVLRGPLTISDLEAWVIAEGRPVRAGNLQRRWLAGRDGRRAAHPLTGWPSWDRHEVALDSAVTDPAGPEAPAEMLFALAAQLVTTWMGDDGFLRSLTLRPCAPFRYGDALRLSGSVVDRYRLTGDSKATYHAAALRITGTNQLSEEVLAADAVALLTEPGRPIRLPLPATLICEDSQDN